MSSPRNPNICLSCEQLLADDGELNRVLPIGMVQPLENRVDARSESAADTDFEFSIPPEE